MLLLVYLEINIIVLSNEIILGNINGKHWKFTIIDLSNEINSVFLMAKKWKYTRYRI